MYERWHRGELYSYLITVFEITHKKVSFESTGWPNKYWMENYKENLNEFRILKKKKIVQKIIVKLKECKQVFMIFFGFS